LLSKIAGPKKFAVLYRSVSEKYENSIDKLTYGVSEDKLMPNCFHIAYP